MRTSLLFIPIAIAIVCGIGLATCAATGSTPHLREMLIAAATCLVAGVIGMLPLAIVKRKMTPTPLNVSQAALIGTMLHLGAFVVVMGVVLALQIRLAPAFTWWLMAFYATTLVALAVGLIGEVRAVVAPAARDTRE